MTPLVSALGRIALACLLILAAAGSWQAAWAAEAKYFRLGTGPIGKSHFAIGGLIANALSNPPGSRPCERGGSCGVPGLIAVAQSTEGAAANVEAIATHALDAALVQANIAYWAFHGTGIYAGKGAVPNLRAVAMLYPDSIHLAARQESSIASVRDLRGKRVALGEKGSGTLVNAQIVLKAYGLKEKDLKAVYLRPGQAADQLASGQIDAMFLTDAVPAPALAAIAEAVPLRLIGIDGPEAAALAKEHPFFEPGRIPDGAYPGRDGVPTLDVGMVLLVDAQADADLIYAVTKALWHPATVKLLKQGHPRGAAFRFAAETGRMGLPLHAGAAAYYFDAGMLD